MTSDKLPRPSRFEFFQAVRLLQNFLESEGDGYSDTEVVCSQITDEKIKFRSAPTKRFPVSEINGVSEESEGYEGPKTEVEVSFFGLFGAISALPWHDTERAIKQGPFREFLAIFNHRMTSLFYRAWEKNKFFVGYEKSVRSKPDKPTPGDLTNLMFSIIGLQDVKRRSEFQFPADPLIRHLLFLAKSARNSIGLKKVLQAYFPDYKICIEEFNRTYLVLDQDQRTQMDSRRNDTSSMLGVGTILGSLVADYQSKFRIKIGPVRFNEFRNFLPQKKRFQELKQMVRFIVGGSLDFDVQFIVSKDDIPKIELNSRKEQFQLGQNTWLASLPFDSDKSDPVFDVYN